MVLRILTYNIRGLPWAHCSIETMLLWAVLKCKSDVICLQEVFTETLKKRILLIAPRLGFQAFFPEKEPYCFGKRFLRFGNPSGLCTLVQNRFEITVEPVFSCFLSSGGVDRLVTKGYFSVKIPFRGHLIQILNTHFQSDFTEFSCFRINYSEIRIKQEEQLFLDSRNQPFLAVCGDFNKNDFLFFRRFDDEHNITFPDTGEHLDHLLVLSDFEEQMKYKKTTYFPEIDLSDHIPVLFEFDL